MSEKKKSLPKELIKKENTAKKPGSPKAKGFHTVDIKLERLKEKFKIHEEDRIIYKDSKHQTGGQVIRFGKCKDKDKQKVVHYLIIAHLDIDSDNNRERKFYFPDVFSKGYMKKELLSEKDKNFPAVQPVSVVEKETGKKPEKQTVSNMGDSGLAVKEESPATNSPVNQPARKVRNSGIENLLSETKHLVDEISSSLKEAGGDQGNDSLSDEQTESSEDAAGAEEFVWHRKFGKGTVLAHDKEGYIIIHFDKEGKDYEFKDPWAFDIGLLTKGGKPPADTEFSLKDAMAAYQNVNIALKKGDIICLENRGWGYIVDDTSQKTIRLQFDTKGNDDTYSLSELQTLIKRRKLFTKKELEARRAEYLRIAEKEIRKL